MRYIIILISFTLSFHAYAEIQHVGCGSEWINIHKENPELIGIYVRQLPDNLADQKEYQNKHPALVVYVFKNNKAHQVEYTPSGQVENGFWFSVDKNDKIYSLMGKEFKPNMYCSYWVNK